MGLPYPNGLNEYVDQTLSAGWPARGRGHKSLGINTDHSEPSEQHSIHF